jgi:hypothetical protein
MGREGAGALYSADDTNNMGGKTNILKCIKN